jgi:hypothetical protein
MEHGLDLFSLSQFLVSRFLVPSLQTGNVIFLVPSLQTGNVILEVSRSQSPDWECYLRGSTSNKKQQKKEL